MLNFTGSTKKRVVNLGDSRGGNKNRSFLEQARKDRQERENARQRERFAIVLQSYVRRYLSLRSSASEISSKWAHDGAGRDSARWCSEASFIIRFGSASLLENTYPAIYAAIDRSNGSFPSESVFGLVKALNVGLHRGVSTQLALNCLLRLFALYPVCGQHNAAYQSLIRNVMKCSTQENTAEAIRLIFAINLADSPEAFVYFLANTSPIASSKEFSTVVSRVLEDERTLSAIQSLSGREQVSLLLNILTLKPSSFDATDYLSHARVLIRINPVIVSDKNNDEHRAGTWAHKVTVSLREYETISILLSSSYVRSVFKFLNQIDKDLCARTLSQLLYLFPESRTSLCMIMSITPELPSWLYAMISDSSPYHEYISAGSRSIPKAEEVTRESHVISFEELVYTYNQILSSWLVVSKDTESFQKGAFPLENIRKYCEFLRSFCFNLIKNNFGGESSPRIKDFKEIAISVLNQLYIKNLRLQFLPNQSWKVEGFELHSRDLILESEEDDSSSDEEEESGVFQERQRTMKQHTRFSSQQFFEKEILKRAPFFVDFTTRVKIFQNSIRADKVKNGSDSNAYFFSDDLNSHKLAADISRESVLDDAFENFFKSGENFKNDLKVTFFNQHGPEAGIDGGGLTKEFLTSVVSEGFNPQNSYSLFKESSSYNLYPNDEIFWKIVKGIDMQTQHRRLMYTKFLGMIIGKCLYEGILIDVSFAPSFLSKWRVAQNNSKNSIDDLVFLDPELYANLNKLLEMNEEQLQDLDLNFTIDEVVGNETFSFDLQPPNGAQQTVTLSNRLNYIHQVSYFKLNQSLHFQTKNFLEGLFQLIKPNWLNMFDPLELQMLISGGHDIDLQDWKSNVQYGGYFDDDVTVNLFWEVVEEMSSQERCDLLKFVTSVSRAPLLGFGVMYPKFGISNAGSSGRLPTASTCLNLLKLPDYKDKTLIRQKLLYSIHANSGFDLS